MYLAWNERGVIWRVRHDLPPELTERLAAIVAAQPATDDLEQAVRARGMLPLYGTSWRNRASQRVAAKLDLIRVAGSLSIE